MKILLFVIVLSLTACTQQTPQFPDDPPVEQIESVEDVDVSGIDTQTSDELVSPDEVLQTENVLGDTVLEDKLETNDAVVANKATIATSKGQIEIELFPAETPQTVANFAAKASNGFYEDLIFHRVEDWVIQGGDPLGNGTGGGDIPTELSKRPFEVGSVGVARAGNIKVSNDSQFFICVTECGHLTAQYTNFGHVIQGMDVVKQIAIGDVIESISIE